MHSVVRVAFLCALLLAPAFAAENEPSASDGPVIPSGQDELLAAMLGKGATLPDACKLDSGEVDQTIIKATYKCAGNQVVFELSHPSKGAATATRTTHFAITLRSGSPPEGLADAMVALIRSREAAFEWKVPQATPHKRSLRGLVALAAAGVLGIAALGWALRRRTSPRPTELP